MELLTGLGIYLLVGFLLIVPIFRFDRWHEVQSGSSPRFPPHWRGLIFITIIGWPLVLFLLIGTVIQLIVAQVKRNRGTGLSRTERTLRWLSGYREKS